MVIDETSTTCVVLHGRGFVGRWLVLRLLKLGNWIVRIADSAQSLLLDPSEQNSVLSEAISSGRASYYRVDVRDKSQVRRAIEGAKNVINACRNCNVKRLIYNSSADIVFDGSHDIRNGDESLPNPWKFDDVLSDFKAQAEALVLHANDYDGLLTCSLRPSNVFGPGDTQFVPFMVNQAKSGRGKFIIGNGENMSDFTFVENVAHAHICAEEALCSRMVSVAGKAFFITNLEPVKFWEFVSLISEGLGYQRPLIKLPPSLVWYILFLVKWLHEKLGLKRNRSSVSPHYIIQLASHTRTFSSTGAQKHIGYSPVVSLQEGVTLTIESLSHLGESSSIARYIDFNEQSKVDKLLGSGKVADILLWRDEKKTFMYFLVLVLFFYWFFLCGRTFISSAAKLLLLLTVILSGRGILPEKIFGFSVQRISLSWFEISETVMKDSIATIACFWNKGFHTIRSLAQGEDWSIFFKVATSLYFFKMISSRYLTGAIGAALVLAFTSFFVYEQYEEEVDSLERVLSDGLKKLMGLLVRNLPASVALFVQNYGILHQDRGHAAVKVRQ